MERKIISTAGASLALAAAAMQGFAAAAQDATQSLLGFDESTRIKKPSTRVRLKGSAPRYIDKAGMPHNGVGDKIVRRAMVGTVGVRGSRKGFLDNWSSAKVASMGLGDRRRAKG